MLDIKDLKLLEFQFFVFDNNLIFSDFIDFLIIKSLKSRKNTWILLLISISSLPSSQNGIRIYLNINIPVAHCALSKRSVKVQMIRKDHNNFVPLFFSFFTLLSCSLKLQDGPIMYLGSSQNIWTLLNYHHLLGPTTHLK